LIAAGAAAAATSDHDAQKTFDSIYGPSMKAAVTPAKKVDLARQLLREAGPLTDARFQAFLYEKAFELGTAAPAGYPVALEAMDELAKARPDLSAAARQKALSVLARECDVGPMPDRRDAADEYMSRLLPLLHDADDASAEAIVQKSMRIAELAGAGWAAVLGDVSREIRQRQAARRSATTLQAKLQQNPKDPQTLAELVQLLLIDLGQPNEAMAYADSLDAPTRRAITLSAKPLASLSPDEMMELGNWYEQHAMTAQGLRRASALRRARDYFQAYLSAHTQADDGRLRAKVALADIDKAEARDHASKSPMVDLLPLIDPVHDAMTGTWKLDDGKLQPTTGASTRLLIPYEPPAEFNFTATFERTGPIAEFFYFPFARRTVAWTCSCWDGQTSGFEMVVGKDARANSTTRRLPESSKPGPHTVEIRVRVDSISAYLDGKLVVRHLTNGSDLATFGPGTGAYGLGVGVGEWSGPPTVFSRIELFEVNGHGRALKHPR
jgi:hypothetical protein